MSETEGAPDATRRGDSPLAGVRSVRVGTRNEPKLGAVRSALADFAPRAEVRGVAVDSGVPEQPVGLAEIARGARNRARAAFESGACDLAVGIEDGLVSIEGIERQETVMNIGCAVVFDGKRDCCGLSSGFSYPPAVSEAALRDREPIGDLFDAYWHRNRAGTQADAAGDQPSAVTVGNIGKLTLGVLPRSEYGRHAVLCALVRFLHPDLYDASSGAAPSNDTRPRAEEG